ncbi:MAG TPA: hypothetical protein VD905_09240, partial [Flavobacteriales bacterium]|nr:hypothetical protein [Flavobacteriales bacterium]
MLIKERSLEKQVCTTITTTTLNIVLDDQFPTGTGSYIPLSTSTVLGNSGGKLKVGKSGGSGAIGCYKDFVAIAGTVYTLNFDFDKGNLAPGHSVIAEVIDLTTSTVVFTSPALTVTGSYGTYSFTAVTSGGYRLRFTRLGPPSNKSFLLDNIKITYTTSSTTTTCVTASQYRYGFNGMEKDEEVKGKGNSYTTLYRQYDSRLGRWLSLDPKTLELPWQSPYCSM